MPLLLRGWWRTQNSTRESWWIHVVLLVGRFKRQARPWRHMISMISWKQLRIWTHHSGMTTHSVCIYIYILYCIYIYCVYIYILCIYIYVRVPWYKRALLHRTSPTNHHENTCDPKNIKGSSTSCKTLAQGSDGIPQVTEVFRSEPDRQRISWSWNIHWFNGWLFHVFFPSNYVAVRVKYANSGRRTNWTSEFL